MANRETRLCRSARAKAGHARDEVRPAVRMPRTMVPDSRTRATTPVARMVYQRVVEVEEETAASISADFLTRGGSDGGRRGRGPAARCRRWSPNRRRRPAGQTLLVPPDCPR